MKIITDGSEWRELERQLAEESSFDRLLEREEEMESKICGSALPCSPPSASVNARMRWLQRALNRVSASRIAENGIPSIQTRRALQKFQSEQGLRPTGTLGPRTTAALIQMSGIPAPRSRAEEDGDGLEAEMEALSGRCPADSPYVIRGFNQYSDDIRLLPPSQQNKLAAIAAEVVRRTSATPGATPDTQVIVVGHADMDAAREKREPGFLQYISEKRAAAVSIELFCRAGAIRLTPSGRGARSLAVPAPRTEAERSCNRRVEVKLVSASESLPRLDQNQSSLANQDFETFKGFYHVALQGTSGQYPSLVAARKAAEIAEKVVTFVKLRGQESARCTRLRPADLWQTFLLPFFTDALQGTAQKYPTADEVVSKAYEIAKHSLFLSWQERKQFDWRSAKLRQAMAPDCEIVRGKVPGPANHALCGTHGHILDTTTRTVIAHDLDEYKKQPRR